MNYSFLPITELIFFLDYGLAISVRLSFLDNGRPIPLNGSGIVGFAHGGSSADRSDVDTYFIGKDRHRDCTEERSRDNVALHFLLPVRPLQRTAALNDARRERAAGLLAVVFPATRAKLLVQSPLCAPLY
jgi:hypothetical protein